MMCMCLYDAYVCMYRMTYGRLKVRIFFTDNEVPSFKNQNRPYIVAQGWAIIILINGPSMEPNVGTTVQRLARPWAISQFSPGKWDSRGYDSQSKTRCIKHIFWDV